MNIWLFNHYALSPDIPGSSRHFSQARELVKRGHQVTIFASSFHFTQYVENQTYENGKIYIEREYEGVKFIWIRTYPYVGNTWKRYINILDYTWKVLFVSKKIYLTGKPDVVIGSSFHLFAPLAAYHIAKRYKVPFVSEIRDLWPETLVQLGTSPKHPLVIILRRIERFVYRKSVRIIVLFPKAHEYILSLNLGIDRNSISWIPNGVDVDRFDVDTDKSLLENDLNFLNDKKFNVINAGSLGNVYALEYLIDAAQLLQAEDSDIHFYLVGNGPLKSKLMDYARSLNLSNLTFHDSIPKLRIPQLLRNGDVLYASLMKSPLYKWGMSLNKVSEYLAAGKPVIFAVDAVNNPVSEAGAGITVESDNPRQIADAVLRIKALSDYEKNSMGTNGVLYARRNYDFKILTTRLEEILVDVVNESKSIDVSKAS